MSRASPLVFSVCSVRLPTSAPIVVCGAAAGRQPDRDRPPEGGHYVRSCATFAIVVALLASSGGCTARETRADRPERRPIVLPDLSRASESVTRQLRDAHASLTRTLGEPDRTNAELARAYGQMGMLLMAAEYRDEAAACFLDAQALAPADIRWPYYLAHLYKARGETVQSSAAFERALRLQPSDPPTLVWLANAYLDQGRPETAEPLLNRVLAVQPRSAVALFGLGRAALARSDYAGAVQHLEQALSLAPQAAVIHYPLAMAYRGAGDMDRAEAHMRQRGPGELRPPDPLMLELESMLESAVAYEVRGAKALDERDWKLAAASFRKGIELAPNEPSLHHKLGTALFMSGDAPGAFEQFEAALRLSPTFAKAHYSLGVMMGASGRPNQAIEHLSAAVRDDPAYVEARVRLADVLRATGRLAEALVQYEHAAKLDPRAADGPFGYAMTLIGLKRYQQARDRLMAGMKGYPDHVMFAHALVRLLAAAPDDRVRDGRAAMRLMQDLRAKEPRTPELDDMMAMVLAELGQCGEAVTWERDAIGAAERAGRTDLVRRMAENLSRYERGRPCRAVWTDEDAGLLQ
jgi:tetratricopeptide (TPR) repeat protein